MNSQSLIKFLNRELVLLPGQLVVEVDTWKYVLFVRFNFGRPTFVSRRRVNRQILLRRLEQESDAQTASEPTAHYQFIQYATKMVAKSSTQCDRVKSAYSYLEKYNQDRTAVRYLSRALTDLAVAWCT